MHRRPERFMLVILTARHLLCSGDERAGRGEARRQRVRTGLGPPHRCGRARRVDARGQHQRVRHWMNYCDVKQPGLLLLLARPPAWRLEPPCTGSYSVCGTCADVRCHVTPQVPARFGCHRATLDPRVVVTAGTRQSGPSMPSTQAASGALSTTAARPISSSR